MGRAFEVRKAAMQKTAAAKSKLYARYSKEIYMAAKSGSPDPEINLNLKRVIEKAKKNQVSSDIIKRALDKAKGGSDDNYDETRYEGFGPANSLIIVECLTDNVNRTIHEVRNCFTKTDGKLGVSGSVAHMFNHFAVFELENVTEDEILEVLIENDVDVEELEQEEENLIVYGDSKNYNVIRQAILEYNPDINFLTEEIMWLPIVDTKLTVEEDIEKFERLIRMLDELEDVQNVYHNVDIDI